MMGHLVAKTCSLPLLFLVGAIDFSGSSAADPRGIAGAIILGCIIGSGSILLRKGNIDSANPATNSLMLLSPLAALFFLSVVGIELPRIELFIVGAALIVAINVLIQAKPDEERDYSRFGKVNLKGTRLGFTSFILSIWAFGTWILLRDRLIPKNWLTWTGNDYWGLLALSATIFALILGFRLARLSTRIREEDDVMFRLFRKSEALVRNEVLDPEAIAPLERLDTADMDTLGPAYNEIRTEILAARSKATGDDEKHLLDLEIDLDVVIHSKQQGRDLVEILSLMAFSLITIILGTLAQPNVAAGNPWTSFLMEMFTLIFVSTIAFLSFNLFDIRRERQTPLLVAVKEHDGDFDSAALLRCSTIARVRPVSALTFVLQKYAQFDLAADLRHPH